MAVGAATRNLQYCLYPPHHFNFFGNIRLKIAALRAESLKKEDRLQNESGFIFLLLHEIDGNRFSRHPPDLVPAGYSLAVA
jgi:hypothetical protein